MCECKYGYIWNNTLTECINGDIYCQERLGSNAEYDDLGEQCICLSGYVFDDNEGECISEDEYCNNSLGSNSHFVSTDVCECDYGYLIDDYDSQCINEEEFCENELGDFSEYVGNRECGCSDGYELREDECKEVTIIEKVTTNVESNGFFLIIIAVLLVGITLLASLIPNIMIKFRSIIKDLLTRITVLNMHSTKKKKN